MCAEGKKKHTAAGLWLYILGDGNEEDKLFMEDDDRSWLITNGLAVHVLQAGSRLQRHVQ